jgi:hypothetical protein
LIGAAKKALLDEGFLFCGAKKEPPWGKGARCEKGARPFWRRPTNPGRPWLFARLTVLDLLQCSIGVTDLCVNAQASAKNTYLTKG